MSKIIGGILLVIVIVGGYFSINKNKKVEEIKSEENKVEVKNTSGKKMAFSEFIKNGGSYKCTVHQYVGQTDTVGTTYVNSGMVSGKYETKVNGMNIVSNVLVRDGYSYSWNSIMPGTGFKSKVIDTPKDNPVPAPTSGSYSFNAEQIGDYDCKPDKVDQALFAIPASITFKEIN